MGSIPYTPHDRVTHDQETHKIDNDDDDDASLFIVYHSDYIDQSTPKEYSDPWLQRVVDLGSFVDALQTKRRSLRERWSEEESERISGLYEQPLEWGKDVQNERRRHWLGKISGRLFRGSNGTREKSVVSDAPIPTIAITPEPCPPAPQSLPMRRLRRTPALRELSSSPTTFHTPPSEASSSTASGSTYHRRVVSEPIRPPPKQPFFNAFMSDVVGDVSSSIRISDVSGASSSSSQIVPKQAERPRGASAHYPSTSMPPFSSPSNLSTSSSDYSPPPTPPPKHSTPFSKLQSSKRSAYYSPLDLLRYHPQSEFGTDSAHKTPIQALQARLPPDEAPTVRSAGSLRALHVTALPRRQPSCSATPVIKRPSSPESCSCQQHLCNDDIAFSPHRPRLMNGAGYFHVKLVSEDQGDGCTVETWKIFSCDECNRQSRPPGTRLNSIASESVTSTHLCSSSDEIDYDAYITADEGLEDDDNTSNDPSHF